MTLSGTSIVGVGMTPYTRNSGVSVEELAVSAIRAAAQDAGLDPRDIDGLVTFGLCDTTYGAVVGTSLGLKDITFLSDQTAGGNVACSVVAQAAMAVATGQARYVAVYRALNGASGIRYGGGPWSDMMKSTSLFSDAEPQFLDTVGLTMPAQHFAMLARRHMVRYGTTHRDFAAVAMNARAFAQLNDRAQMRAPMALADYEASPWIADPFRMLDCCVQTDGACAMIVTTADRARDLAQKPVQIRSAAATASRGRGVMWTNFAEEHSTCYAARLADRLFEQAGVTRQDLDFAQLYDCFTYSVLVQLEDFGLCPKGEAGAFFRDGQAALGGALPVNTNGGLLSEGYIHGLNSVTEAVIQLRGDAGPRQVRGAEVGLVSAGGAANSGSALILGVA